MVYRCDSDTASTSCSASAEDDDEVLSVGCESPPPRVTEPRVPTLKFSIDNILRPEFGGCKDSKCSPIDLSKEGRTEVQNPSPLAPDTQQPLLWPAWVYCTRYSDRPSSGEFIS